MCVCDAGYAGAGCTERTCPLGDDPLTSGGAVDEVQGFTLSGAANDGAAYALRFTGCDGAAWTTAAFAVATDTASSAAMAANAAAIKSALESLPGSAAGAVTATCGTDYGAVPNVRCTVAFTSLPGNVPDLVVLPLAGAAPVVAQPAQPVHVFANVVGAPAGGVGLSLRFFPADADAAMSDGAAPATQWLRWPQRRRLSRRLRRRWPRRWWLRQQRLHRRRQQPTSSWATPLPLNRPRPPAPSPSCLQRLLRRCPRLLRRRPLRACRCRRPPSRRRRRSRRSRPSRRL